MAKFSRFFQRPVVSCQTPCYIALVKHFFRPNINHRGRIARGVIGSLLLIAGIIVVDFQLAVGLVFVVSGLFAMVEAVLGWCVARACGIRTKY